MFNINIKASNMELTPAITDFINEKIGSLEKFVCQKGGETETQVWVEIGLINKHHHTGNIFRAEVQIGLPRDEAPHGARAVREGEDLYAAIDDAKNHIKNELSRLKAKKRSVFARGAEKIKNLFRGRR